MILFSADGAVPLSSARSDLPVGHPAIRQQGEIDCICFFSFPIWAEGLPCLRKISPDVDRGCCRWCSAAGQVAAFRLLEWPGLLPPVPLLHVRILRKTHRGMLSLLKRVAWRVCLRGFWLNARQKFCLSFFPDFSLLLPLSFLSTGGYGTRTLRFAFLYGVEQQVGARGCFLP